jgi:lipopolysaccharide export LptBFGC system permease protein LptF
MSTTISGTSGVTFPDSTSMQTGQQACKAWVNFNGTGAVAIRAAYNVSSITDDATGQYTVNFTTAMPDGNYVIQITAAGTGSYSDWSRSQWYMQSSVTTSSFRIENTDETESFFDSSGFSVSVFR